MASYLALFLCVAFVGYMLMKDHYATPDASPVLWIPTVWMLYISSKPLGVWFGQTDMGEAESGSPLDRNALIVMLCLTIGVLIQRRFQVVACLRRNGWLLLLVSFMLVSTVWSDSPFTSFKRWVRQFQAVLIGCVILSEADPSASVQTILRRITYILVPTSLLLVKYYPEYGVVYGQWFGERMWVGVTTQKNALGRLCLISGFFLLWTWVMRWRRGELFQDKSLVFGEAMIVAALAWLIRGPSAMAASATALTVFAFGTFGLGTLLFYRNRGRTLGWTKLGGAILFLVTIGILTPLLGGATLAAFTGSLGRDATLTGRTDIWAWLVGVAAQNPILGTGFGGFWTSDTIAFFRVNEAHNGYLAVILETGALGMAIHTGLWLSVGRAAYRALDSSFESACLCICFLLMSLLHNISESSMNILASPLTATVIFLGMALSESGTQDSKSDLHLDTAGEEPAPLPRASEEGDKSWRYGGS